MPLGGLRVSAGSYFFSPKVMTQWQGRPTKYQDHVVPDCIHNTYSSLLVKTCGHFSRESFKDDDLLQGAALHPPA